MVTDCFLPQSHTCAVLGPVTSLSTLTAPFSHAPGRPQLWFWTKKQSETIAEEQCSYRQSRNPSCTPNYAPYLVNTVYTLGPGFLPLRHDQRVWTLCRQFSSSGSSSNRSGVACDWTCLILVESHLTVHHSALLSQTQKLREIEEKRKKHQNDLEEFHVLFEVAGVMRSLPAQVR